MLNKIIIFLIRRRLKLGSSEYFRFANQKTTDIYYFDTKKCALIKKQNKDSSEELSGVSLNWLLSSECEIIKVKERE